MNEKTTAAPMTSGPIWQRIIAFAVPLFLGNLFQQFYNTADSLIVGNFLGSSALAAVSSSGNLIFLLVGFFNGLSVGAGVVIGRFFGAGDLANVKRSIHTTIAFGLAASIPLTIIGVTLAPKILVLMGTPSEVLPNSVTYFQIYFGGSISFVMYNVFVGILQALGDSRHPLIYLIVSSITNIVLDLLFVAGLGLGVGAAAFATVISQLLSALLCLRHLFHVPKEYRVRIRDIRFDFPMLRQIVANGLPAGIQNSIISLANVVVQSNINAFGAAAMAGCGTYSKIEGFGFLPITCFALSMTTFTSQNLGAKKYDRVKKGAIFGCISSIILAELVGVVIYLFIPTLASFFNRTPEVIAYGTAQARTVTLFYFLLAFSHCAAGILRGAGRSLIPMLVMMVCWCIIRVSYITLIVKAIPVINVIFWAYPLTWTLSTVVFLLYLLKSKWLQGFQKNR